MAEPRPMQVDVALVRELATLLDETDLTEIEVADGERRVRVARTATASVAGVVAAPAPGPAVAPAAPAAIGAPPGLAESAAVPAGALRSPMVGTAYLSPEPGAPPFVREGDDVKEGQTLLIIEAMKVMNPITAPRSGRVTAIFVANEQPVEFDQPLLVIA